MTTRYQQGAAAADAFIMHRPALATSLKSGAAAVGLNFSLAANRTVFANQPLARQVVARECSGVANTGDFGMAATEPSQGVFTYTAGDWFAAFCTANGLEQYQGGHLLYHNTLPAWLSAITDASASRSAIENHITNIAGHFGPLGMTEWNVVNEVINGDIGANGFRNNYFYQVHGTGYPTWAFQSARAARPSDHLIWNENKPILDDSQLGTTLRGKVLDAIDAALAAGAPIDGFGCQVHLHLGNAANAMASPGVVVSWLNEVASRGLAIHLTELDVSDGVFPASTRATNVSTVVRDYIGAVCQGVPSLVSVGCWGVMHSDSWLNTQGQPRADGLALTPLPFDGQGHPTSLAQALLDSFAMRTPI